MNSILQKVFKYTQWRQQAQLDGVLAALLSVPTMVVILPTGYGKSMIWMIPALRDEHRFIVVIIPYCSLITDILRRCASINLPVLEWQNETSANINTNVKIIVLTLDCAIAGSLTPHIGQTTFLFWAMQQYQNGLLRRIVYDECHTLITEKSFRHKLSLVWNLRRLEVPVILMTATLPFSMRESLEKTMLLPSQDIFYAQADRLLNPFICFSVKECRPGTQTTITYEYICKQYKSAPNKFNKKILIFVGTVGEAVRLSSEKLLKCYCYTARMTREQQQQQLTAWTASMNACMVATTSLMTGLDIDDVDVVMFAGLPYQMIHIIQGAGRTGRRNKIGQCLIFAQSNRFSNQQPDTSSQSTWEWHDSRALQNVVQTKTCRISAIYEYLSGSSAVGRNTTCYSVKQTPCDLCRYEMHKCMHACIHSFIHLFGSKS